MWRELLPVGRHPDSRGYRRYAWTGADADCRAWFREQAEARGLALRGRPEREPVGLAGGPGGRGRRRHRIAPGLRARRRGLRRAPRRGVLLRRAGRTARPGRSVRQAPSPSSTSATRRGPGSGSPSAGSRLTAGQLTVEQAHRLTDGDGVSLPQAMEAAGYDPEAIGPDPERLARIGAFVELHVEQGRALDLSGDRVGIASAIWPHGRWRFDFRGEANHAGTTRLTDRRDPMLSYAETVLAARREARLAGAVATFGKISVEPNGVNAIPSLVRGWLDSRAADQRPWTRSSGSGEGRARVRHRARRRSRRRPGVLHSGGRVRSRAAGRTRPDPGQGHRSDGARPRHRRGT